MRGLHKKVFQVIGIALALGVALCAGITGASVWVYREGKVLKWLGIR